MYTRTQTVLTREPKIKLSGAFYVLSVSYPVSLLTHTGKE